MSLARNGNTLFIGGTFTSVGGQTRNRLAAIDRLTGTVLPWTANANNAVWTIEASGTTLYAGGHFTTINGSPRSCLAAVDQVTGTVLPWAPDPTHDVRDILVAGPIVFVGGEFDTIGGEPRERIAAVDTATGMPTSWATDVDGTVWKLLLHDTILYVGGAFSTIGGESHGGLALLDVNDASLYPWTIDFDGAIKDILVDPTSAHYLYVGGAYSHAGTTASNGLSVFVTCQPVYATTEASACGSYSWNGTIYTATGVYQQQFQNAAGCDSIVTLELNIHPLPVAGALDNGDATITASGGTEYQWLDCTTDLLIAGETGPDFAAAVNGYYAAVVSDTEGCADTSACILIDYMGLQENGLAGVTISPNPAADLVTIVFTEPSAVVTVRDAQGKLIGTQTILSGGQLPLTGMQNGVYFFEWTTENGRTVKRIIKQ